MNIMKERSEPELEAFAATARDAQAFTELQREGKLRICAWCRKVPVREDYWVDVDAVRNMSGFISAEMIDQATHGVCPDCFAAFIAGRQRTQAPSAPAQSSQFVSAFI